MWTNQSFAVISYSHTRFLGCILFYITKYNLQTINQFSFAIFFLQVCGCILFDLVFQIPSWNCYKRDAISSKSSIFNCWRLGVSCFSFWDGGCMYVYIYATLQASFPFHFSVVISSQCIHSFVR